MSRGLPEPTGRAALVAALVAVLAWAEAYGPVMWQRHKP